jgi:hypothetical protein
MGREVIRIILKNALFFLHSLGETTAIMGLE